MNHEASIFASEWPDALWLDSHIVPFDQLATFDLTGRPKSVLTQTLNLSIEGHFVAIAMSYSVRPEEPVVFGPVAAEGKELQELTYGQLLDGYVTALHPGGVSAAKRNELEQQLLRSGFQLNPALAGAVERAELSGRTFVLDGANSTRLFQAAVCPQEEINFLYAISDQATGRENQNDMIHNLAGLGRADGERPFRFFPEPILFAPRSTIRVQLTEISGRGRLYFVLQGYKVLDSDRIRG